MSRPASWFRWLALFLTFGGLGAVETVSDAIGAGLRQHAIWTSEAVPAKGAVHGAFRSEFTLDQVPKKAPLHLFAASRYCLWVNGTYVLRGPARFELQAAEYDTVDVAPYLRPGRNVLAILVHRDLPTGRIRHVAPGLAVDLDLGTTHRFSDATWQARPETTFGSTGGQWSSIRDRRDATAMADWTPADFPSRDWPAAVPVARTAAGSWPELVARRSALQSETDITFRAAVDGKDVTLPLTVTTKTPVTITTERFIQAYPVIDFTAEAGTEVVINYHLLTGTPGKLRSNGTDSWRCRAGRQTWMVDDTNALSSLVLSTKGGSIQIHQVRLVEVLYPFKIAGSFTSPDPYLNHLWTMMARGAQILSEDAYVDCAERERVEWMECSPPMAQTTRVAMVTPSANGDIPSDPALLKAVLWRTAQTQRDDGMVKAHTCSERWDKHAIMVDRSCDWIQLTREYLDHTGDLSLVREIWPTITRQLDAFLAKRTPRGLIKLEEWADWGNHYKYRVFEGTVLNSFMYAALRDGAALGIAVGDATTAARFTTAADALRQTMLAELWDAKAKTMGAGLGDPEQVTKERRVGTYGGSSPATGLFAATRHSAVYALRWNVIDDARREQLYQWVWAGRDETMRAENAAMLFYHLFEVLYAHDDPAADAWILSALRIKWKPQVESPMQTPGESLGANGVIHCYSMYPTYILSSYVLGVRLTEPVGNRRLLIDPRLGDLPEAAGTVVTEFGLVPVSWQRRTTGLTFQVTVPAGVTATVRLPTTATTGIMVNGKPVTPTAVTNGRPVLTLTAGTYQGTAP